MRRRSPSARPAEAILLALLLLGPPALAQGLVGPGASLPVQPAVSDPQLAPPPAAGRVIKSWDEALALIRTQSPDYRSTYDDVLRAQARARVALAGVLPSASGQISFARQFITSRQPITATEEIVYPLQDLWGVGGTLVWPVGDPRAWYAKGTADAQVDASQHDLSERRRALAQAAVGTMVATLAAERVAELDRVGLRAALERLALTRTKVSLGSGTPLDVERAEQDAAAARALVISGDEALRQSREALGLALGSADPIAVADDLDPAVFERAVLDSCRLTGDIDQRPDIRAARQRVAVADRVVNQGWLQFAPQLLLESQYLWNSQVLYGPNANWDVLAVLNVPIWDGGATYGQLRDAHLAADQARQALASARLDALVNVAQAAREVGVTEAERDVARRQRDLAFSIDQRTREGYLHGLGTSLDLVTSAQALRQAEINLALLQFQATQARLLAILAHAECTY